MLYDKSMLRIIITAVVVLSLLAGISFYLFSTRSSNKEGEPAISANRIISLGGDSSDNSRISTLETAVSLLTSQLKNVSTSSGKSSSTSQSSDASLTDRIKTLETTISDLQKRISNLEKGSSTTQSSTNQSSTKKAPSYIPLGSGSTSKTDWTNIDTLSITLDPADYPGYTSMQLETSIKIFQNGEAYARLGDKDNGTSILASEISTTSQSYTWITSSGFQLPSGKKTYIIQMKSLISGYEAFVENARIKVNY